MINKYLLKMGVMTMIAVIITSLILKWPLRLLCDKTS